MKKSNFDIHERVFNWVISCLSIIKKFPDDAIGRVIKYQLAKSCTSVGANDQEADNASSRKDFIAKYKLVKKELAESIYWLKIVKKLEVEFFDPRVLKEADELLKIIGSIILNTQKRS